MIPAPQGPASVQIKRLKDAFARYPSLVMDAESLRKLDHELDRLRHLVLDLELENARISFAANSRRDRAVTDAVLAALNEPDSNLTLFPVIPRPAFHDGHPRGAA